MTFQNHSKRSRKSSVGYEVLEPKRLLATVSIQDFAGRQTLVIDGDSRDDVVFVLDLNDDQVRIADSENSSVFNKSDFERIRFLGRSGNDYFENRTDIDSAAFGHNGNDILIGGNGHNWIQGGGGNDRITGGDRNDLLRGRGGNDIIDGGRRHDRIFGDAGNDELTGSSGNDFIQGGQGRDFVFALNGNDRIEGGDADDVIDGGAGNDQILYDFANGNYSVSGETSFFVTAANGNEGTDRLSNAETLRFTNTVVPITNAATATERVTIRPIILSNSDGSNTAGFFGNQDQENEVKDLIDSIFAQADVDIQWEQERFWNNTFANIGNGGFRPSSDIDLITDAGDNLGFGSPSATVVDVYFVEVAPGFNDLGENFANGLAYINAPGAVVHVGDNLASFSGGRRVIANVVAHEIGHTLGLEHVEDENNLLAESDIGSELTASQVTTIRNSFISRPI